MPKDTTVRWDADSLLIRPEPPSANVLKAWLFNSKAKYQYARYRDNLAKLLTGTRQGFPGHVVVTHHWRTVRVRDEDGLGASLKPVLDALVLAGILRDDAPAWLTVRYGSQLAGGPGVQTERGLRLEFTGCA